MTRPQLRRMSAALGAGAIVFGVAPAALPTFFGRVLGIACADNRTVATAIRSVGVRDLVIGLALVRAARRGDDADLRRWLLARTVSDAGDALGVSLGVLQGERDRRFLALGALAAGAFAFGAFLCRAAR